MKLKRWNNSNPQKRFDIVLNNAYARHYKKAPKNQRKEPGFVRGLISEKTIRELNAAAASVYDAAVNTVYFRGAYLHGRPYAAFSAIDKGGVKECRRELADAIFVVYVTAPKGVNGRHTVIRRSACMLMFKREDTKKPFTPTFDPIIAALPRPKITKAKEKYKGDSDKEQFYLFNGWPPFNLQVGGIMDPDELGNFYINNGSHDIGKYALIWEGQYPATWLDAAMGHCWLYADPLPNMRIAGPPVMPPIPATSGPLGLLLESMLDGVAGAGRDFTPKSHVSPIGNWDELLGKLLGNDSATGYLAKMGEYYGEKRDINPVFLNFLSMRMPIQNCSEVSEWSGNAYQFMHSFYQKKGITRDENVSDLCNAMSSVRSNFFLRGSDHSYEKGDGVPILIATVHMGS